MLGKYFTIDRFRAEAGEVLVGMLLSGICMGVAPPPEGPHYTGRVIYKGTRTGVPGVLVELVEAEDDGKPTDDVLGSGRADAAGKFNVPMDKSSDAKVFALIVVAVRESAESGGDRRGAGYDVKTRAIQLGWLSRPNPHVINTIAIERRKPGHSAAASDE